MSFDFKVRPFGPDDYDAAARVFNEAEPEHADRMTAERIREFDRRMPSHVFRERWVAEHDGEVIAHSVVSQNEVFHDPRGFVVNAWVLPAFQRNGIGSRLYDVAWSRLCELGAEWIESPVLETGPDGIRFLEKRGFRETHRQFQSVLDLGKVTTIPFIDSVARLEQEGIRLRTLEAIASDEGHRRAIFDLHDQVEVDIPGGERRARLSFEGFWKHIDREVPPGGPFWVAMDGAAYVGIHFCLAWKGSPRIGIGLTGVRSEYRGRGIATALKALGIQYAKDRRFEVMSTWNDSRNQPMLALNGKFGFERRPARVFLGRKP